MYKLSVIKLRSEIMKYLPMLGGTQFAIWLGWANRYRPQPRICRSTTRRQGEQIGSLGRPVHIAQRLAEIAAQLQRKCTCLRS